MSFQDVSKLTADIQITAVEVESGDLVLELKCSYEDKVLCPVHGSLYNSKTQMTLCRVLGCSGCMEIQRVKK